MDIPALSIAMEHAQISSDVSIAMFSKTLELQKEMGADMIKMMERSVNPNIGRNIDISV